jgi:hypothetical protein
MRPHTSQFDENDAPEWFTSGMTPEAMDAAYNEHGPGSKNYDKNDKSEGKTFEQSIHEASKENTPF